MMMTSGRLTRQEVLSDQYPGVVELDLQQSRRVQASLACDQMDGHQYVDCDNQDSHSRALENSLLGSSAVIDIPKYMFVDPRLA